MKLSEIRKEYKSYLKNGISFGLKSEKKDLWEKVPVLYSNGNFKNISTWRYLMFGG